MTSGKAACGDVGERVRERHSPFGNHVHVGGRLLEISVGGDVVRPQCVDGYKENVASLATVFGDDRSRKESPKNIVATTSKISAERITYLIMFVSPKTIKMTFITRVENLCRYT